MSNFIERCIVAIVMGAILGVIFGVCVLVSDTNMSEEEIDQIVKYDEYKTLLNN